MKWIKFEFIEMIDETPRHQDIRIYICKEGESLQVSTKTPSPDPENTTHSILVDVIIHIIIIMQ